MSEIRPDHYKGSNIECIDAMRLCFGQEAVNNFCLLNAFKYLWRYDRKDGAEDLRKAKTYISMLMESGSIGMLSLRGSTILDVMCDMIDELEGTCNDDKRES